MSRSTTKARTSSSSASPSASEVVIALNYERGGARLGRSAEWCHYIGIAALTFPLGGVPLFAAYLVCQALPIFLPPIPRFGRWLFPSAMVLAAIAGPRSWIPLLGLVAGLGSASSARPPAWMAGLYGGPGWAGILGAGAGFAALAAGGPTWLFLLAAALATLGALDQEAHEIRLPPFGALAPAAMAMGTVIGFRVIEPALVRDRLSAALFGVSWAAGIHAGWARAPSADARGILALPFIAAAALASLSIVTGPGMVFLWAIVGASVGGVLGVSTQLGRFKAWPWIGLLTLGALSGWVMAGESIDFALWTAATVALAGGFSSLVSAGRVREPAPTVLLPLPASTGGAPEAVAPSPSELDTEIAAAIMLLEALREARRIRTEALQEFRKPFRGSEVAAASNRARSILVDLITDARRAAESLRSVS